jgi:hypothetical protein
VQELRGPEGAVSGPLRAVLLGIALLVERLCGALARGGGRRERCSACG